ncbi:MAG: family 78 glycoside hydrolase catalytic domain [Bacteroidales bacterium]|nr:family 78 glycoside hydrolase catalytic domain [Bacteroidales bacterium]
MRIPLIALLALFLLQSHAQENQQPAVINPKCENLTNAIGIDNPHPRFSWQIKSDARNVMQTAYHILVSDNPEKLNAGEGNVWDSRKVKSDRSILVPYKGIVLEPAKKYYWKVMVWDNNGNVSAWSETASWQMGLLSPKDWDSAKWICYENFPPSQRVVPGVHQGRESMGHKGIQRMTVPIFRKDFKVDKDIASATLFISGLGHYEAYLNGSKIGNAFLSPGWTEYDKTILYNTFDVTANLLSGKNVIGAIVGNGFYNINRERYRKLVIAYGAPKLICKLSINYTDGTTQSIVTDKSWKSHPSPVTYSSIYGGEDYDARLGQPEWSTAGFDDSCWKPVNFDNQVTGILKPELNYPVQAMDTIKEKQTIQISEDKYLVDFGQNASGIFELKLKGKKGQVVRLLPSELIDEKNEINQRATGRLHYYTYTLKGEGIETWQPSFTYYGFRYIQVEGAVSAEQEVSGSLPVIKGLNMLHTRNSAPQNGSFHCSNELFNRIYSLIDWAIRSNFQSVLTDCPHREKLGWLEQTFLMGNSVNYNYETYHLYQKLIDDMIDAQTPDGLVPSIVPEYTVFEGGFRDSPEWGSASVILPWLIYKWYGDKSVMEKAWPMMVRFVNYLKSKSENHIVSHGLGDWFDLGPERPGFAQLTPVALTATAIYYHDLKLLSEMAGLLQKKKEQVFYSNWAEEVRIAFNNKFFDTEHKVYSTGSQTAMAMPLCLGIVNPADRAMVLTNLVDSIIANNKALTAGDIGFHYLVRALTAGGESQLLFEMNNRDDVPGYGYQLKKGATALTESWPALEIVSNNHLMLGHLMEWFYSGLAGIGQEDNSTGYKNIVIKPAIVGDLSSASTTFHCPYGEIKSGWKLDKETLTLQVKIPANTTALIYLPVKENSKILENNIPVNRIKDLIFIGRHQDYAIYRTGSGNYNFKIIL